MPKSVVKKDLGQVLSEKNQKLPQKEATKKLVNW